MSEQKEVAIIKSIHKDDAFYGNRKVFVGQKIVPLGDTRETKRNFVSGTFRFQNKYMNNLYGKVIFYAVKLERGIK